MSGPIAHRVKQLAHMDIPGGGQVTVKDGIAFVGHLSPPHGTSIIDVKDPPRNPRVLSTIMLPDFRSHSHKARLAGDVLIVNSEMHDRHFMRKGLDIARVTAEFQSKNGRTPDDKELARAINAPIERLPELKEMARTGYREGGFRIYDVSDLSRPREIAFQRTGGIGVHRFDADADYAYISTEMEGYRGNILVIYDVKNPARPQEVSRWWMPGQHVAGGETPHWQGVRNRLHHGLRWKNEIWAACWYGGFYIVDVSDIAHPKTIGHHNYHPPFPEPTHTIMRVTHQVGGRTIAIGTDEEHPHPNGQPHAFFWVFDVADYSNIKPLSTFHVVDSDSPCARAHLDAHGNYGHEVYGPGAHQFQEHLDGTFVFCTWFSAGLRILDIANPFAPKEVGSFVPSPAAGFKAPQSNDVDVDANGPDLSFEQQVRMALANLLAIVEAGGSKPDRVLKVTAFIVGVENWPVFNAIYAEVFGQSRPARSVVPVPALHHGCLIELETIAARG
jgi:hypothetical protein